MYAVQLSKREFDLFHPDSKIASVRSGGTFGKFKCEVNNNISMFRFYRKKDAVKFAIWAAGWATAYLNGQGEIALITPLFD